MADGSVFWGMQDGSEAISLASRAEPGDLDAWVLATAPRAVAYALSLLRDRDQAEDIVQDCYCRLLQKAHVYDLPRDGLRLLLKSVSNACINLRTRRKPMLRLGAVSTNGEALGPAEPADKSAAPPEQSLAHRELAEAIAAGLEQLPPQQRAALELKSLGHTQQEIAEILGVSGSNAGVLVHRARTALAGYLAPYLGPEAVE
jgi:RNA polymerase sigma factor (sigma-70 family)